MKWPLALMKEAEIEAYIYFDKNIRILPKNSDGEIDPLKPGFQDNDVDAFRHAYVSGVFAFEYSENIAEVLGWMNEFVFPSSIPDRNMDLWNNAVGRHLAKNNKTREALAKAIKFALGEGDLITTPGDSRVYKGSAILKPNENNSVIVIKQNKTGGNEAFFDFESSRGMTKSEFLKEISDGKYPGYEIRKISGIEYPVSKRDSSKENNLG